MARKSKKRSTQIRQIAAVVVARIHPTILGNLPALWTQVAEYGVLDSRDISIELELDAPGIQPEEVSEFVAVAFELLAKRAAPVVAQREETEAARLSLEAQRERAQREARTKRTEGYLAAGLVG